MNLDTLQQETEKLLSLLQDRHPGLIAWNVALRRQLSEVKKLAALVERGPVGLSKP